MSVVVLLVVAGFLVFFALGSCLGWFETHKEREERLDLEEDKYHAVFGETEEQKSARHVIRDEARKEEKVRLKAETDKRAREVAGRDRPAGFLKAPTEPMTYDLAPLKV
jgi:hypothetical protein